MRTIWYFFVFSVLTLVVFEWFTFTRSLLQESRLLEVFLAYKLSFRTYNFTDTAQRAPVTARLGPALRLQPDVHAMDEPSEEQRLA